MKIKEMIQGLFKQEIKVGIFSESPLQTSLYEELQKNGWCDIISDKPDDLFEWITWEVRRNKKNSG